MVGPDIQQLFGSIFLFVFELLELLLTIVFVKKLRGNRIRENNKPSGKQELSEWHNYEKRERYELYQVHFDFTQSGLLVVGDVRVLGKRA